MRTNTPRDDTELHWKGIWEKEASYNPYAQLLLDLRKDQSNLPEQDPVNLTMADIQERVSRKSGTAPGPDMIHSYWLKKLTAFSERLVFEMNQLLKDGTHPDWIDPRSDGPDHEESPRREQFQTHG